MARREDRRGRAETLESEAGEGVQKDRETCGNQQHSYESKPRNAQKRYSNMPSTNPPRNVTCDDSWSNDEEYCRSKNGRYSPHWGHFYIVSFHALAPCEFDS